MPDDEVQKLSFTTTIVDESAGAISSVSLEELQDSFGIYQENLPKNQTLLS